MLVKLEIYKDRGVFVGESLQITASETVAELMDQPVQFYGNTKQDVINNVISYLHSVGKHGKIRLYKPQSFAA